MMKNFSVVCLSILLVACSSGVNRVAAPPNPMSVNSLFSDPTIRVWGDVPLSVEQLIESETLRKHSLDVTLIIDDEGNPKPQHHLTISGGGANGAYGAGLLNGLTQSGERPEYRLVTGISTGAIIGLYAFLGEEYDDKLKSFYTQLSDQDLYQTRYIWQLFSSSSLLDTAAFEARVRKEIDRELLNEVKKQYLRGRSFLVQTTNLDEQRPVIWNMGAIAMHDTPEAEALFESVILASASIPGIFEPVLIPVYVDGVLHDEMHVDGGVIAQVFFIPEVLDIEAIAEVEKLNLKQRGFDVQHGKQSYVWLINNARIGASWHPTALSITDIVSRSISTMIKFQGRSSIAQVYKQSQLTESSFNYSYIPDLLPDAPEDLPFDKVYMQSLYCYGYALGLKQSHWSSNLPNYAQIHEEGAAHQKRSGATNIRDFDWEQLDSGLSNQIHTCLLTLNSE
ncbi:patatin-like phospholipase family protein [uncultured Vibrio sp.]|uniref:patatin-like phospholipase family protein n=1 Tax=uncultured Vibrio sp. TaxID=114054 RepID=UPI0025E55B5F|nr:patatin-like phospholipase family protein [uncultured Vibrio sp.]